MLDHGLQTALTALAARCDLPVELALDLPERPSAAIETIAYFCAAETRPGPVGRRPPPGARRPPLPGVLTVLFLR
ncbi:MAG TPA: hypothetical protein VGS06_37225 [Streptosporangiaceae bacterium]|nr:hypothetical protein [Streptosporangiaceae bacterium]